MNKKKFKVTIPYFDSGTKKEHTIDFYIDAVDKDEAFKLAYERFTLYEKSYHASWVRIIRKEKIKIEEKND